jgi:adenylate kinase family enzyme
MDGNFAQTFDLRMPRADTLIWLDLPRHVCIWRVLKRVMSDYGRVRPDLPDGCPERFDWKFLQWTWAFNAQERPLIAAAIERFGTHLNVMRLSGDRQVKQFLAPLGDA